MRPRPNRRRAVLEALIVWVVIATVPACTATAGGHHKGAAVVTESAPSGNIVYRPAYPAQRTRAFYLSSYAGVVYPPVRRSGPAPTHGQRAGRSRRWFAAPAAHP